MAVSFIHRLDSGPHLLAERKGIVRVLLAWRRNVQEPKRVGVAPGGAPSSVSVGDLHQLNGQGPRSGDGPPASLASDHLSTGAQHPAWEASIRYQFVGAAAAEIITPSRRSFEQA